MIRQSKTLTLIGITNLEDSLWSDPISLTYHKKQWSQPKASTLDFIKLLHPLLTKSKRILDVGCGSGAATYEISKSYLETKFVGIDSD
jgi:ubiquinone/menaquinone biosynthesis C-methylase UbiE